MVNIQYQNLSSFKLPSGFRGRSALYVQVWWIIHATLFSMSPQFMYGWRRFLLRAFGASIGSGVLIRPSVRITYPWKLSIGDNSWIGDNVELYTLGEIIIGSDVVISQRSYLCTAAHDYNNISFDIFEKKIVIEDQVWLATNVFVAPGVLIGRGAVVGVSSLVLDHIPSGMVCYGSPAKPVSSRII